MKADKSRWWLHFGLVPKLILLVVLATLLVGTVVGALVLTKSRDVLRGHIFENNLETADLAAQFAFQYVNMAQTAANELATRHLIVRAAATGSFEKASPEMVRFLQLNPCFDSVSILDPHGIVRVSGVANPRLIGTSFADQDWFQQTTSTRRQCLGVPLISRATGRPVVPYGVPIFDERGELCGIIGAGLSLAALSDAIVETKVGPEARASLTDLRHGGIILAHVDPKRILSSVSGRNEAVRRLLAGERGVLETINSKGERVLTAIAPVPRVPWGILITQPSKSAFATLNALTRLALLLGILAILMMAIISGWMALRIIRPLLALRDAANALAAGDLTRRVKFSRRDEIGELAQVFNGMADALQREQTVLRDRAENFFNLSVDLLCVAGFDCWFKMLNPAWERTLGFTTSELLGRPFIEFVHPDDRTATMEATAQLSVGQGVATFENRYLCKDGSHRQLMWNAVSSVAEQVIYAVAHDVTERRQAEAALRRTEENFRRSMDDSPLGKRIVTSEGETIYANRAMLDIYGYDSIEEFKTTQTKKHYTPESYAEFRIRREKRRQGVDDPSEYGISIIRKNGEVRHLRVFRKEVLWDGERQYQAIYQDITERKRAEEELVRSDREKTLLLKEIHHRVKNNLQIIASLLRLNTKYSGNERVEEIFRESQDRIRAMAAVHSLLYKSKDFTEINFGDYIRETARQLFRSYNTRPEAISLFINAGDVMLSIDTAIPCGLIINELLSNALKHAFPDGRRGEIRIEMNQDKSGVRIVFADNGVGLPEGMDFRSTETLGLQLVNLLVAQLDGNIERVRNGGIKYVITLKIKHR